MKTVIELLGPPAAGKTSLADALREDMPVIAEQVRALLLAPDPPPPGPERQIAIARRIAAEVAAAPDGPVLLDLGWVALVSYAYAEWPAELARALATAIAGVAAGPWRCRGLVVLSAPEAELRRRAAEDAATGRWRGDLDRNLSRHPQESELLRTAETVLPHGMLLRPASSGTAGQAAEVRTWLAADGPTMDPTELVTALTRAWTPVGTTRGTIT